MFPQPSTFSISSKLTIIGPPASSSLSSITFSFSFLSLVGHQLLLLFLSPSVKRQTHLKALLPLTFAIFTCISIITFLDSHHQRIVLFFTGLATIADDEVLSTVLLPCFLFLLSPSTGSLAWMHHCFCAVAGAVSVVNLFAALPLFAVATCAPYGLLAGFGPARPCCCPCVNRWPACGGQQHQATSAAPSFRPASSQVRGDDWLRFLSLMKSCLCVLMLVSLLYYLVFMLV